VLPKADSLFGNLTEPLLVDGIPAEAANFAHTETSKAISSERKRVPAAQPSGDEEIEVPGRTRLLAKTSPYADIPSLYDSTFRKQRKS